MLQSVDGISACRANIDSRQLVPKLFDVHYTTNSQRFRGKHDYSLQSAAGVTRIAAIGDSLCFGVGANDDQSYPVRLESLLRSDGRSVEIINAGVGGTGTGMQALWYDRYVKQYHPHLVVLTVFVNDIDDDFVSPVFMLNATGIAIPVPQEELLNASRAVDAARAKLERIPLYSWLSAHSHLVALGRRLGSLYMTPKAPAKQSTDDQKARFMKEGVPRFIAEMQWLKDRVEAGGAKLVIAWFPTRETIYPDSGPAADEARWQAKAILDALARVSTEQGVAFFEPTAAISARAKALLPVELYYSGRDRHPTPAGYDAFAGEIHAFLMKNHLVPIVP